MRPILTSEQSRAFDRQAIDRGVPGIVLMENAGRGACEFLLRGAASGQRYLVVCGAGNNGGDGYVVARRLLTLGESVQVVGLCEVSHLPEDARLNAEAFAALGGELIIDTSDQLTALDEPLSDCDQVVDGIFGTGLSRPVTGRFAKAIDQINESHKPVFALDLPSGLDADRGGAWGALVVAARTATFGACKPGLFTVTGSGAAGHVEVVDIGVPAIQLNSQHAAQLDAEDISTLLRQRRTPNHKGEAGRVVVVAGSPGKLGAAKLVAHGAHRGGAGLITIATERQCAAQLDSAVFETMTHAIDGTSVATSLAPVLQRADVVAVGPGLGSGATAGELIEEVVLQWPGCAVVDADALSYFQGAAARIAQAKGPRILTPHPAEAARLLGTDVKTVQADRFAAARELATLTNAVVVLKGVHSLVAAPGQWLAVNSTGNSALSTGGSGDVLTGVIGAFAATLPARSAALAGVFVVGRAAEAWVRASGSPSGMLVREAADRVPEVVGELRRLSKKL